MDAILADRSKVLFKETNCFSKMNAALQDVGTKRVTFFGIGLRFSRRLDDKRC